MCVSSGTHRLPGGDELGQRQNTRFCEHSSGRMETFSVAPIRIGKLRHMAYESSRCGYCEARWAA